jgi:hypothetical protein
VWNSVLFDKFRKELLHEISLKSTERFSRVTDSQAGRALLVASSGHVADNRRLLSCVPRSVFSDTSCVPAAEDKPNGSLSVESGPRVPWFDVRLQRCTVGQI